MIRFLLSVGQVICSGVALYYSAKVILRLNTHKPFPKIRKINPEDFDKLDLTNIIVHEDMFGQAEGTMVMVTMDEHMKIHILPRHKYW